MAIARALAMGPQLLLMDEPTASLDPARRGELAAILRQLATGGCTLLVARHDEEFVRGCAHRVLRWPKGASTSLRVNRSEDALGALVPLPIAVTVAYVIHRGADPRMIVKIWTLDATSVIVGLPR